MTIISSGVTSSFLIVRPSSPATVLSGGIASHSEILGGVQTVSNGGVARFTQISGGSEIISSGGVASFTTVSRGGQTVSFGGVASSTTVNNAGSQTILSGGSAIYASISGLQTVQSGGIVVSTTVTEGGEENILSGGVASDTVAEFGGTVVISGGGTDTGTVVIDGSEIVYSGGSARGTIISAAGQEILNSGATASYAVISGRGAQYVSSGAMASFTTVSNGGAQYVYSGGAAIGTIVDSGGSAYIYSGGTVISAVLSGGALAVSSGGIASKTTVDSGGALNTALGANVSGSIVSIGGSAALQVTSALGAWSTSGANTVDGVTIDPGAIVLLNLHAGASVSGLVLFSGGQEIINSGALASGTIVSSGGIEYVSTGGAVSNTIVSKGGFEFVYSGGVAIGTTVGSGGSAGVVSGGLLSNAVIDSGGMAAVSSGGLATGTVVSSGGSIALPLASAYGAWPVNGTNAISGVTIDSGAVVSLNIFDGGSISGFVVRTGASETIFYNALDSGTVIDSGGSAFVFSGGTAEATTIESGGVQYVGTAAFVENTVIGGGSQYVYSGGFAYDSVIGNGGYQYISGGTASGTTVGNGGREVVSFGGVAENTIVSSGGEEDVAGRVFNATIDSGGYEVVSNSGLDSGAVVGSGGTVIISASGIAAGMDVQSGGRIDLASLAFTGGGTANLNSSTDTLTVSEGGVPYTLQLSGSYTGEYFHLANDSNGGTLITLDDVPCYCRSTRIRTPRGEVAVEDLRIGDRVTTTGGAVLPIKWIGRRSYRDWLAVGDPDVQPIRFKAGSIADHVPARDLYVSPEHAMLLDGVLVPARLLVNGVSILKVEGMEEIDYFHFEFDRHVVILAEGAAAESFVDDDSRMLFHNGDEYRLLYPDAPRRRFAEFCAPRVEGGYALGTMRRRLMARAARLLPDGATAPAPLRRGYLDLATRTTIEGWAFAGPGEGPVTLAIVVNGAVIGQTVADRYRADLAAAGIGDGCHAFRFHLPHGLSPEVSHRIEVRRDIDWSLLQDGCVTLEPDRPVGNGQLFQRPGGMEAGGR